MRRIALIITAIALSLSFASPALAQTCNADPCSRADVGPFMMGISKACGNQGDCSLEDIMVVFSNVGNFILGLIGSLVLLMFVIGGLTMLTSQGAPDKIAKGKKYLVNSTIGLIIVFVAYAGIATLNSVLTRGGELGGAEISNIDCAGQSPGTSCGDNMQCTEQGACLTSCAIEHPSGWDCIDINTEESRVPGGRSSCQTGKCPGAANIICCPIQ